VLQALETWKAGALPDNPPAWLFRVAKNKALDVIRRNRHAIRADFSGGDLPLLGSEYTLSATLDALWMESSIEDDMLGMMFACCHPGLHEESQIALVLKTLGGFTTAEIAQAFLATEDTISKRLFRAKEFFRREKIRPAVPPDSELRDRLGMVLHSIYLIFNEGYRPARRDLPVRRELMEEALSLGRLAAANPHTADPRASALMALLCFQAARSESRQTAEGDLILLPDQDRALWDAKLIGEGVRHLDRSATGEAMTAYHLEAAIAWEHCRALSFAATDWTRISDYYRWLCLIAPGPVVHLNRLVAVLQAEGPAAALRELASLPDQDGLRELPLYHSLSGEIHARLGDGAKAREGFLAAAERTGNDAERKHLRERAGRFGT
jgi:predicted RNA polymerase sigma factor